MRNAGSSIMMYDIIILENFRFRPPTRSREASVFKNLHSGQRFRKHGFSVAVFTGNVWTAGHWRKKSPFHHTQQAKYGYVSAGGA